MLYVTSPQSTAALRATTNLQACRLYNAYQNRNESYSTGHQLASFLVSPSGKVNANIVQPLRHDLARVLTDAAGVSGGLLNADTQDLIRAAEDCGAVKVWKGQRA